ncbi:GNAT family N-acetyltransferase [Vibrio campbellii]|uniref:GNAT family N-acetyltransferase n=1 Tax=Vibrio campbellii TaxID=680 RepID=UPI003D0E7EAC
MYLNHESLTTLPFPNTKLELARPNDAAFINALRANVTLNAYVSHVENDVDAQKEWLLKYLEREQKGQEYYFIIRNNNDALGTVRLYDFDENIFRWGSWMILPNAPIKTALESMLNLYYLAFDVLNFEITHIDVRNDNKKVLSIHKKMGCKVIEVSEFDTVLELSVTDYNKCKDKFYRILR